MTNLHHKNKNRIKSESHVIKLITERDSLFGKGDFKSYDLLTNTTQNIQQMRATADGFFFFKKDPIMSCGCGNNITRFNTFSEGLHLDNNPLGKTYS